MGINWRWNCSKPTCSPTLLPFYPVTDRIGVGGGSDTAADDWQIQQRRSARGKSLPAGILLFSAAIRRWSQFRMPIPDRYHPRSSGDPQVRKLKSSRLKATSRSKVTVTPSSGRPGSRISMRSVGVSDRLFATIILRDTDVIEQVQCRRRPDWCHRLPLPTARPVAGHVATAGLNFSRRSRPCSSFAFSSSCRARVCCSNWGHGIITALVIGQQGEQLILRGQTPPRPVGQVCSKTSTFVIPADQRALWGLFQIGRGSAPRFLADDRTTDTLFQQIRVQRQNRIAPDDERTGSYDLLSRFQNTTSPARHHRISKISSRFVTFQQAHAFVEPQCNARLHGCAGCFPASMQKRLQSRSPEFFHGVPVLIRFSNQSTRGSNCVPRRVICFKPDRSGFPGRDNVWLSPVHHRCLPPSSITRMAVLY